MPTSCTFKTSGHGKSGGTTSEVSGSASLADVVVNTTPTATGGWNTATVTADKQRSILLNVADATTAGVEPGWYDNVGGGVYRKQERSGSR